MTRFTFAIAFTAALVAGTAGRLHAQAEHYGPAPWELNLHVGALFVDGGEDGESDTDPMYGARLGYNTPGGFGFGGNFDYVQSDADLDMVEMELADERIAIARLNVGYLCLSLEPRQSLVEVVAALA